MNPLFIITLLLILVVLTSSKKEAFRTIYKPYPAEEIQRSYPRILSSPIIKLKQRCPTNPGTKYDPLVIEKRQPGLIKQRYSYDDSPRDRCRTKCYTRIGADLKSLPLNYKNPWKATVDARLLQEFPLLNADAETAKREELRTRQSGGHLFNLAKKTKCITPYTTSDFIPGKYTTRNEPSNYYHLGQA